MRKVIVVEWMSLDGVVQSPAYADEDPSGGFAHGGWHLRYFEDVSLKWVVENVTSAGAALKREDGEDLLAIGSTELVQTLIAHALVDELRLMIDPVVLGGGKRFFRDDGRVKALRLVSSEVTTTGAILATYARAVG